MKQDRPNNPQSLIFLDTETGEKIGRHPRDLTPAELNAAGHNPDPLSKIIRRYCIDCAGGQESEVRKCTVTACDLWPYRMGTNPFAKRDLTDAQREAKRAAMVTVRAARKVAA